MGAAAAAGGASVVSLGLSAMGTVMGGQAQKSAADFKAAQAEQAAKFGRLQADLTDVTMRENLNKTLYNIDAIRAGGNVDPSSPTTAAIEAHNTELSDRQRTAQLVSLRSQADADEASAHYLRQAGDFALTTSYITAGAQVAGGIAKGFGPQGSFNLGA